ncbi:MAG: squalene synthase HpnC [Burkholderiaceae bacterium]|nr:MAG: squalene synthase HpnC [Burkholderiaceae bacterium]
MTINHYENFPVASILVPAQLRPAVRTIYAFARSADDFADEGDHTDEERIALLDNYDQALLEIEQGSSPSIPLFVSLSEIIRQHQIPVSLFRDLLSAFKQDIRIKRYDHFDELLEYCRRSANPVGRIMLDLFGQTSASNLEQSDAICTALQLINFWLDVAIDLEKGRIYLPQEDLHRLNIADFESEARSASRKWQDLMSFQVQRARELMYQGAPLAKTIGGRFGFELRMVVHGGLRILEKIEAVQYDVFNHRPTLNKKDLARLFWRSLRM